MKDLIQKKLEHYRAETEEDEENALKEITQEICLYALSESGFFDHVLFQGGTCLRIVHGLDRFSEDLDFSLKNPKDFDITPYLEKTANFMKAYGYQIEIAGEAKADNSVQTRFLKDDSIKKIVTFKHLRDFRKKINIKVELDINPPYHGGDEVKFLDFPTDYSILCHDMSTLFAGKIHALLCRPFIKGRDWYDFSWYLANKIEPNYKFLSSALNQLGPWRGTQVIANQVWLKKSLEEKIKSLEWQKIKNDIIPFLKPKKKEEIEKLWSSEFFLMKLDKLL